MSLLSLELIDKNIIERSFFMEDLLTKALSDQNWRLIDEWFLKEEKPGGKLYQFLREFLEFKSIEHIIAIRKAPEDEDGIWHDDGSRILGFSLSLTLDHHEVSGGELRFRAKGTEDFMALTTRPFGQILLFKTGIYGFEHMVSAVTKGQRIVIAGWCS